MSQKKLQQKKKKKRERKSHAEVLKKRKVIREEAKNTNIARRKNKEERYRAEPIVDKDKHDAEIMAKLKHNLEILKALEAEYDKEQAAKIKLQTHLKEQEEVELQKVREAFESEQKDGGPTGLSEGSRIIT